MLDRPLPFPNISPIRNLAVMDVHLNNYDQSFVKPIAEKMDLVHPLIFTTQSGKEVEVNRLILSDPSKATYNESTQTLTLINTSAPVSIGNFTDLIGVPNRFPTSDELKTGHDEDPNARETAMFLVAKPDGIYFENHPLGTEIAPRTKLGKDSSDVLASLEQRISHLEQLLK